MPDNATRRRFIAGAVCPRCALMDKIVVDLDTDQRECVSCGFAEGRPDQGAVSKTGAGQSKSDHSDAPANTDLARELPTRVSRPAARRVETPAEVVTLVDPRNKQKPDKA
jgi:uncharacterized metal-binding protein (TIGR02443 family)